MKNENAINRSNITASQLTSGIRLVKTQEKNQNLILGF